MKESFERKLDVLYDLLYVVRNSRMAKRIQSGDSISRDVIFERVKNLVKLPGLTRSQFKAVQDYYYPYKVSTFTHREMIRLNGKFRPDYMPSELYYAYIDPYLNDKSRCLGLENKCLFPRLFPGITQPECIAFRMNGFWLDSENRRISHDELMSMVEGEDNLFVKQAEDSFGGIGVVHISRKDGSSLGAELEKAIEGMNCDIIIQKAVRQHPELSRLCPSSVNTMRIVSLLMPEGVKIVGSLLRFASGDKSVDNYTSGGMMCAVNSDGYLNPTAYSKHGDHPTVHPVTGVKFEDFRVPSYDRALELVKKAHPMLPYFRLVGWDVAIREDGEPVLIEANLSTIGLETIQLSVCPVFGDDTKRIIDEAVKGTDYPRRRKDKAE